MTSLLLSALRRSLRCRVRLCGVSEPGALCKSPLTAGGRRAARSASRFTNTTGTAREAPASGRYRQGVLMATGVFGIVAAGVCHLQQAEMATRVRKEEEGDTAERCRSFMAPPVTEVRVLEQKKREMSSRMEMLIMETQAEFCRALQEVDGGTFKVDRWSREEGDGGLVLFSLLLTTTQGWVLDWLWALGGLGETSHDALKGFCHGVFWTIQCF